MILPERLCPFFGLLGLVSRLESNLLRQPIFKRGDRQDHVISLHGIRIFGQGLGQFLYDSKQIDTRPGPT